MSKSPSVTSLKDVDDKNIGIELGYLWMENVIQGHNNVTRVDTRIKLAEMLRVDEIAAFLTDNHWWSKHRFEHPMFHKTEVYKDALYLWLRKDKEHYSPKVLKALRSSGDVFDKYK